MLTIEKELFEINREFIKYVEAMKNSLAKLEKTEEFFIMDLSEFDKKVIKYIALLHPQGEFLREAVAYLKITSFLDKISKSIKNVIKRKDELKDPKINALYQNALSTLDTLVLAVKNDAIEDAYSSIISYEKIADELYKDLVMEIKQLENIEEILKKLKLVKRLEQISDNSKTIAKYLLFAKEGIDL